LIKDERNKSKMRSHRAVSKCMRRPGQTAHDRGVRRGFSLVETMLASVLATLLGVLLAMSCATFGRPALEVEARARLTQEGILAAQSIACDLGGFLTDNSGRTGTATQYVFFGWDLSQGNALVLNYYGATTSDLVVITYQLNGNQLVRYNSTSGVTTTIANYVTAFSVEPNPNNASQALIQITIAFRYFNSTYTLIGVNPI
jgi:type II secretory pathway component PulJ